MRFVLLIVVVLLSWSQSAVWAQEGREHVVPLFLAADDPMDRQGFLRVINHSNRAGTVHIHGYDDRGMQFGPVELSLDALQTRHLNSNDVENGNADKGLPSGLGNGMGYWRLVFAGAEDADGLVLDVEPLAYFRNRSTGFLGSLHDVATESGMNHRVAIFNPASNPNQLSWLRVINLGDAAASVMITGLDDAGQAGGGVSDTVPAHGAMEVSAVALEERGLGDGSGKWSLNVMADQPVQVMSLMDVPGGYLSNLSSTRSGYRGATGLWRVSFDDGNGGDGYVLLLPDSRLYAWLPEGMDATRIARGTFTTSSGGMPGEGMIDAAGVVYESGKIEVGIGVSGGSEPVTLAATYRSADWIRGEYTVGGTARGFQGWAFTGFVRGGSVERIAGVWRPVEEDADLPAQIAPDATGYFDRADNEITFEDTPLGDVTCEFGGQLNPINPAYNVFEGRPVIDCGLISFEEGAVELILAIMDDENAPNMAGMGTRAIALAILPGSEAVGLGAVYELVR